MRIVRGQRRSALFALLAAMLVAGCGGGVTVSNALPPSVDTIAPSVPTGLAAGSTTASSIALSWLASTDSGGSGLAGYRVYRGGALITTTTIGATTFTDSGLAPNTSYNYTVRALDAAGNISADSVVVTVSTIAVPDTSPPTAPSALNAAVAGSSQINLTWTAATDNGGSGLAGYRVFRDGAIVNASTIVTSTSFNDLALAANTTYRYTVRAVDRAGNMSVDSKSVTATTAVALDTSPPTTPTALAATAPSSTHVDLGWNASSDAGGSGLASYRVYRNNILLTSVPAGSTSFTDNSVLPSTGYAYQVSAVDGANNQSGRSNAVTVTTPSDSTAPGAPSQLTIIAVSGTQIGLAWTASSDAGGSGLAGYRVFRDGTLITSSPVTAVAFTDTGLSGSTSYSYTVRAVDGAGNVSNNSNVATATTPVDAIAPTVPGALSATASSSTQLSLTWNASSDSGGSGLASYRIYRNSLALTSVAAGTTHYTDTSVQPDTAYTYEVSAVDGANNESARSNAANATTPADTTPPTVPGTLTATATGSNRVNLGWSASIESGGSGLFAYRVYRNNTLLTAVPASATTYSDPTVQPGTTYSYEVTAIDNANNESSRSNVANATTPADNTAPTAPSNLLAAAVSTTEISLGWSASNDGAGSGIAGYRVFRDGVLINASSLIGGTNFNDTGLAANTAYSYRVRAVDNAGNMSADSNPATATTPGAGTSGLDSRPANTTCLAPNEPSLTLSSVSSQRVYVGRSFDLPLLALQAPDDSANWYVVEKAGTVRKFASDDSGSTQTFIDISDRVDNDFSESGLLGMAFHPDYAANGYVFLSYTASGLPLQSRVSRFTRNGAGVLDPNSEVVLLTVAQPFPNHNGGNIAFGPDGYLYIGFGDGGDGGDPQGNSQNRRTLLGKLLRINVSGIPYSIPGSNPYAGNALCNNGSGATACPEIYARGLRNPWRWSFDRSSSTPDIWLGDVGEDTREEIDRITLGGNYGWSTREGLIAFGNNTAIADDDGMPFIDPIHDYEHSVGASVTGGYVYRGAAIPSLTGAYVFGDYSSGTVFALGANESGGYDRRALFDSGLALASFAQDNAGELYIVDIIGGGLYKLVEAGGGGNNTVPTSLADTGCFDPLTRTPATGLVPYLPNAAFWSDNATKQRWLALPNNQTISVEVDGDWSFPNGTVLVKNFLLNNRIIETRLFMKHLDSGNWRGYSYRWNNAQNAATLVGGGLIAQIDTQDWVFPSGAQCLQCHTVAAGRSLGLETAQLNGPLLYPATGRTANQLTTLSAIGLFGSALPDAASLPIYPNPIGASGTLANRARAYLHVNCSQCHRPGGPTPANMDLRYVTGIGSTNTCNVAPSSGDLGIAGGKLIAPGNSGASLLLNRMSRRDAHQMPPLASTVVDAAGAALLSQWIAAMDASCN